MRIHQFHQAIGDLFKDDNIVEGLGLTHENIWLDPACGGQQVVSLSNGTGSEAVRFCQVDILILAHNRLVIIEIEESNVKPLHLFGKFYASAFSTHFSDQDIGGLRLLFIQVLDTSKVALEKGEKGKQWERIKKILREKDCWQGRSVQYELLRGRLSEFKAGRKEAEELLRVIRRFPEAEIGNERRI